MNLPESHGFTLIELSIVLVIIGLIVGGILVGQDMIHAAEIRATIKQIEQLDMAVNTFRGKYNCLPGDCANATDFGFTAYNGATDATANGDGDGHITWPLSNGLRLESFNAPVHLNEAGLLPVLNMAENPYHLPSIYTKLASSDLHGLRGGWTIGYIPIAINDPGLVTKPGHYYWANAFLTAGQSSVFLPIDAFALDSKLDDGMPLSGRAVATGNRGASGNATGEYPMFDPTVDTGPAGPDSNVCVTNDTPNQYNVQNTGRAEHVVGSGTLCAFVVQAAF